jgi:hypothetical protein
MQTEDTSFLDGATYSVTRALDEVGEHAYDFRFVDPEGGGVILRDEGGQYFPGPVVSEPLNANPQVTSVEVTPHEGPPGTVFELRGLYSDAEGECPTLAFLYLVHPVTGLESSHMLTGDGGDCATGTWYSASITLDDPGTYRHRYLFVNSNTQVVNSPPVATDYHEDLLVVTDPTAVGTLSALTHLGEACPNPFNPRTLIHYAIAQPGPVDLRVYDAAGRLVRRLVHENSVLVGGYEVIWDGHDDRGLEVGSGVYFYRLDTRESRLTQRMTLLR